MEGGKAKLGDKVGEDGVAWTRWRRRGALGDGNSGQYGLRAMAMAGGDWPAPAPRPPPVRSSPARGVLRHRRRGLL